MGGDALLLAPGDEHLELLDAPDGTVPFLRELDGTRKLAAVLQGAAALGLTEADAREILAALTDAAVLDDAATDALWLTDAEAERYDRQLRYFATCVAPRPAAEAQAALRGARIAVLGLGGLGGLAALILAACGVGTIVGVDGDRVELSNLARQVMYRERDIGTPKVEATARALHALNRDVAFEGVDTLLASAEDVERIVEGCDLVIAAVDWPAHGIAEIVDAGCFAAGTPYLSMSQQPPKVRVGALYVPGQTRCHRCYAATLRGTYPLMEQVASAARPDSPAPTYAPAAGIIGSLLANEAIAFLARLHAPATLGRAWVFDLRTFAASWQPLEGSGCARCGFTG
ncbi:MAG TPA: ThiF family adenylyltransferase [Solirubrobacteraceae bacterium]|nr:ThiF family adenylyltransferase [Solirubrobacteraceae bacterium]